MSLEVRIKSISAVRNILNQFIEGASKNTPTYYEFERIVLLAEQKNPWFTQSNIYKSLEYWNKTLTNDNINNWLLNYSIPENNHKTIGLVLAGNIPMVGFHDCLCCLLLGFKTQIKLSSKDNILIPFFLNLWKEFCDELHFEFVEKLQKCDAVITTGSNNTARYFEYYFKDIPHIIRKNRTSVAILNGDEKKEDLENLAKDIFTYFGLGCRNVTQLLVPINYDLNKLFNAFLPYKELIQHNKYANNYDYNKAIFLLNKDKFWDNNLILLKESDNLYSPIAALYIKFYENNKDIDNFITENKENIQCIVSKNLVLDSPDFVYLGETQNPEINDYADGVDTVDFLLSIK